MHSLHSSEKRRRLLLCALIPAILFLLSGCAAKNPETNVLLSQVNEFITDSQADGSLPALTEKWISGAETTPPDFSVLTGENGIIEFGTKVAAPFIWKTGDTYAGILPEFLLRFCQKYGYGIRFKDYSDANSLVLAVSAGKCSFGGSSISVTEERKEKIDYSEPFYNNICTIAMNQDDAAAYTGISSLERKKIGVLAGGIMHGVVSELIKDADIYEYNTQADLCEALEAKKVYAIANDDAVLRYALGNYPSQVIVGSLFEDDHFAFVFPKAAASGENLWTGMHENVNRTLIEENRWKLVLEGIGTTVLITLTSIIAGGLLGYILCLLLQKHNRLISGLIDIFSWLIRGLPTVVLLLIMYYIVFGNVSISGTIVSIVSFSLIFAVTVCGLLSSGIRSVDRGQFEACAALGYTEKAGFAKIILPQVIQFSLPGFKAEIIALIKATSIVGYIAVQDLTKTGDIVRSSTYDAFTPLILTAVIYFVLAWLLTKIVDGVEIAIRKSLSLENYLKGVNRHA